MAPLPRKSSTIAGTRHLRYLRVSLRAVPLSVLATVFLGLGPLASVAEEKTDEKAPHYPEHQDLLYYLDSQGDKHPIKTVADWEIRKRHILAHMQRVMGPLPDASKKVPLDVKQVEEVRVGELVRRKLT